MLRRNLEKRAAQIVPGGASCGLKPDASLIPDEDEGGPVKGQVLAVAGFHLGAQFELSLAQGFVLAHARQPLGVGQCHQFLRLAVGDGPHYCVRTRAEGAGRTPSSK